MAKWCDYFFPVAGAAAAGGCADVAGAGRGRGGGGGGRLGAGGRPGGGRGRRRRRGGAFDLGGGAQLGDELGLRLARDIGLELSFDLIEGWQRLLALVFDLDDVPAELRLYRVGHLALVELERGLGKFR